MEKIAIQNAAMRVAIVAKIHTRSKKFWPPNGFFRLSRRVIDKFAPSAREIDGIEKKYAHLLNRGANGEKQMFAQFQSPLLFFDGVYRFTHYFEAIHSPSHRELVGKMVAIDKEGTIRFTPIVSAVKSWQQGRPCYSSLKLTHQGCFEIDLAKKQSHPYPMLNGFVDLRPEGGNCRQCHGNGGKNGLGTTFTLVHRMENVDREVAFASKLKQQLAGVKTVKFFPRK